MGMSFGENKAPIYPAVRGGRRRKHAESSSSTVPCRVAILKITRLKASQEACEFIQHTLRDSLLEAVGRGGRCGRCGVWTSWYGSAALLLFLFESLDSKQSIRLRTVHVPGMRCPQLSSITY
jgi:hypothetical protein